ncbi:MAG: aspartate carbamoyltransferase catalytic subunit, partial [Oceanibaculum sp.]
MTADTDAPAEPCAFYRYRHLLGIEGLHPPEIAGLLDLADSYVEQSRRPE